MSYVDCKSQPLPEAETLRDRLAMAVINKCLEQSPLIYEAAREAYRIADAMMESRK